MSGDPLRTPLPPPPPEPPADDENMYYQQQQQYYDDNDSQQQQQQYQQQQAPPPSPRVVILEQLGDVEKELYFQFLLENDVQFTKVEDDCYVANVRMLIQKDQVHEQTPEEKTKEMLAKKRNKEKMAKLAMGHSAQIYGRRASRPPQEMARVVNAIATSKALFDYSCYPKFSSLVTMRDQLRPRRRHFAWLMKMIEEIYRDRYEHDTADLRSSNLESGENKTEDESIDRLSNIFPVFVTDFLGKRFGLRSLVDQHAWDLIYNVHALRKQSLEVEIFARFLEEYYDPDDLLFFLYVHSVVEKELAVNFVNRWTSASRGKARMPDPLYLTFKECQIIGRVVFGDEQHPLYQAFMAMLKGHLTGRKTSRKDTRKIEVTQFLHVALVEYHETRPAEDEEQIAAAEAAAMAGLGQIGSGGGGAVLVRSKEEQNRLFEEAEKQYNQKLEHSQSGQQAQMQNVEQDVNREMRVQEMEDMILRAMDKRQVMDGSGNSNNDDNNDNNSNNNIGSGVNVDVRQWAEQTLQEQERQKQETLSAERQAKQNRDALMNSNAGMANVSAVDALLEQNSKNRLAMDDMMTELGQQQQQQGGQLTSNDPAARQLLVNSCLDEIVPFMAKHKDLYLQRLMKTCEQIDFPQPAIGEIKKATEGFIVKYSEQELNKTAQNVLQNFDIVQEMSLNQVPSDADIDDALLENSFKGLLNLGDDNQVRIKAMDVFTQTLFSNTALRETIEGHVGSIISYAQKRFQEATETNTNTESGDGSGDTN